MKNLNTIAICLSLFISCTSGEGREEKPHQHSNYVTALSDLKKVNAGNGETVYQMEGRDHNFNSLSIAITETRPGGGPPLHVHDEEEAHVVLQGKVVYYIEDSTFTVNGPFVTRVPPGIAHTFINGGDSILNLIAVFPKNSFGIYKPLGKNPLLK